MDVEYLAHKVKDELKGSKEYIKIALELKPMADAWAKKFYMMSVDEYTHATNFYNLFNEYCSKIAESVMDLPDYISELRKEIVDMYAECSVEIKGMQDLYKG